MKAIIDVGQHGSTFDTAKRQLASGSAADYRLHFESARTLFAHLTPARIELLDNLQRIGACSRYALAKSAGRNYSDVRADINALEDLGLIERDEAGVRAPFDALEIRVLLPTRAT